MTGIGVIGAGLWGPNLIRNFLALPGVRLVGVADALPDARRDVAQRFPGVRVFESAGELLAQPGLEAVVIATPATTHYALTREVLERGLHAFVEKPLCPRSSEVRALYDLAATRRVHLMVDHVFLFNASVVKVGEILRSGALGRLIYIQATRTNLGPVRSDVGAHWDLAAHDLSMFGDWLQAWPEEVSATGISSINQGVADAVFSSFKYPSGVLTQIHASWLNPCKVRQITVVGSERMLIWDDMDKQQIRIHEKSVSGGNLRTDSFASHKAVVHNGGVTEPAYTPSEPLMESCRHFIDVVQGKTALRSGRDSALGVVRSLEAIDRSLAGGGRFVLVEGA